MGWDRVVGGFCLIVGLSLVAGFLSQFRERGYVGWLGLCFLALAAASFLSQSPPLARNAALGAGGLMFLFSFISALLHTRARLEEIRLRQQAFEKEMLAMLEAEKRDREKES